MPLNVNEYYESLMAHVFSLAEVGGAYAEKEFLGFTLELLVDAGEFEDYLTSFTNDLAAAGVRVNVDYSDNRMQKKIREHTLERVPFLILAGARDQEAGTVAFRYRDGSQKNDIPLAEAKELILDAIETKAQV